ncbi:MAG TPA: hypothetical protein VMV45_20130, partial [Casimicrobiaceae bacterium]|nr:hypothetical protein [Casimicrobiaceae bacterium]
MQRPRARIVAALVVGCTAFALIPLAVGAQPRIEPALAQRIVALDCERITPSQVRQTLALGPTPRMILIQGSVPIMTMEPFARFLIAMGYPSERIRNPREGGFSYSSFQSSAELAGAIAWHYEHDGTMPILIGHSQGGMLVVRVLHELAGRFSRELAVIDPVSGQPLPRTSIRDPLTGAMRPVVGLQVGYAAALATGKLARFVLGQWTMLGLLRKIPDSVAEFVGFRIPGDPIAGDLFGEDPYVATGSAVVHNVTLPSTYHHISLPQTQTLASDPATRTFIDAFTPDS